ncbi:hypothetical protein C8R45DRAFT_932251 [Mycena sanguinolenta]|nr:hypothetical protein C8R45DRAFT_932251 [Mycena sanguinolenta]
MWEDFKQRRFLTGRNDARACLICFGLWKSQAGDKKSVKTQFDVVKTYKSLAENCRKVTVTIGYQRPRAHVVPRGGGWCLDLERLLTSWPPNYSLVDTAAISTHKDRKEVHSRRQQHRTSHWTGSAMRDLFPSLGIAGPRRTVRTWEQEQERGCRHEFFAAPAARLQAVSLSRMPMTPLNAPLQLRCTVVKHRVLCLVAMLSQRRPLTRWQSSILHANDAAGCPGATVLHGSGTLLVTLKCIR